MGPDELGVLSGGKDLPPHGLSFEAMVLVIRIMRRVLLMLMWTQAETIPLGLQSLLWGLSSEMSP